MDCRVKPGKDEAQPVGWVEPLRNPSTILAALRWVSLRSTHPTRYLENIYKSIVDKWSIWDSLEGSFTLAESRDQT
jgi:hypothetical protein